MDSPFTENIYRVRSDSSEQFDTLQENRID